MSGFVPLNAGYAVSVRRARLNVLGLLTLALAGEVVKCIEFMYTMNISRHHLLILGGRGRRGIYI